MSGRKRAPVSIWATGQTTPRTQRDQHYGSSSTAHPAKMFPQIARHAIAAYSKPGDLVLDPMCGVGTTLVEALRLDRNAIGVDCEPHWVGVTAANLHLARTHLPEGSTVTGRVWRGDATHLIDVLPPETVGTVDLIVTSPPYGSSTHGLLTSGNGHGGGAVTKTAHTYHRARKYKAQLAHRGINDLTDGLQ